VLPLPEILMDFVLNFKQLSNDVEKTIITNMFEEIKLFEGDRVFQDIVVDSLLDCHKFYRELEDDSSVSLRDILRFIHVFLWFRANFKALVVTNLPFFTYKPDYLEQAICAFNICYVLRSSTEQTRSKLKTSIAKNIKKLVTSFDPKHIEEIFYQTGAKIYDEMKNVGMSIPQHIAFNRPLRENLISMLVCTLQKIPIMICGKPGSSKTLSSQILKANLGLGIAGSFLSKWPKLYIHYYCGSQTSTSEEIELVFRDALESQKKLKDNKNVQTAIIFDEMGLSEISEHNP
jgi:hypothetical protein